MNLSVTKYSIECVKNWYDENSFFKRECLPRVLLVVMGPLSSIGEVFYQLAQFNPSGAKCALANCVMIPLRGFYDPKSCLDHYLASEIKQPGSSSGDLDNEHVENPAESDSNAITPVASPPINRLQGRLKPASSPINVTSNTPVKKAETLKARSKTTIESYRPKGDVYVLDESKLPEKEKEFLRVRRGLLDQSGNISEALEQLKTDFSNPNNKVKGLSKEIIANLYWEYVSKMQELTTHVVKQGRRIFEEQEEDSSLEDIQDEISKTSSSYQPLIAATTAGGKAASLSVEGIGHVQSVLNKVQATLKEDDSEGADGWDDDLKPTTSPVKKDAEEGKTETKELDSETATQKGSEEIESVSEEVESVKDKVKRFGDQLMAKFITRH